MSEPITCRLLDKEPEHGDFGQPGDIYKAHGDLGYWIVFPKGHVFLTTQTSGNNGRWTVIGEAPRLTITPSIWFNQGGPNSWHGFLTDGVMREC